MPILDRILIYPIKALDGIEVQQAKVLPGGSLEHDREFCIVDQNDQFVNGKRTATIHQIRAQYILSARLVTLSIQNKNPVTFHLDHARDAIADWLSRYFGFPVHLKQNLVTGFPDDVISPGPTIISTATLEAMTHGFEGIGVEDLRSRFRSNLELSNTPAFWEEQLYTKTEEPLSFQIGDVEMQGINPCQRCVVPTRDAISGAAYPRFQQVFTEKRKAEFPSWAPASRFKHFYYLAVNTRIAPAEAGKVLQVGDAVAIKR